MWKIFRKIKNLFRKEPIIDGLISRITKKHFLGKPPRVVYLNQKQYIELATNICVNVGGMQTRIASNHLIFKDNYLLFRGVPVKIKKGIKSI